MLAIVPIVVRYLYCCSSSDRRGLCGKYFFPEFFPVLGTPGGIKAFRMIKTFLCLVPQRQKVYHI